MAGFPVFAPTSKMPRMMPTTVASPRGWGSSNPERRTTRWPTSMSPASAIASLTTTSSVASVRARRPSMTTGR